MSPALADELGLVDFHSGVVVLKIRRRSPAQRFFRPGDMVMKVNTRNAATVNALKEIMSVPTQEWRIQLLRDDKPINLVIGR